MYRNLYNLLESWCFLVQFDDDIIRSPEKCDLGTIFPGNHGRGVEFITQVFDLLVNFIDIVDNERNVNQPRVVLGLIGGIQLGVVFVFIFKSLDNHAFAVIASILVTLSLRLSAIKWNLSLPHFVSRGEKKGEQ